MLWGKRGEGRGGAREEKNKEIMGVVRRKEGNRDEEKERSGGGR